MDPRFHTLLFSSATKGEGDNTVDGDVFTTTTPRPSRYAQCIPREALRVDSDRGEAKVRKGDDTKNSHRIDSSRDVADEVGGDVGNIEVYRVNDSGGLELVHRDDYDVVYCDETEDNFPNDDTEAEDFTGESMEVDIEEKSSKKTHEQPTLLIVHNNEYKRTQSPSHHDDASSTSDSTASESPAQNLYTADNKINHKLSAETSIAQTLTRALVQRTAGYESIRRNFGLDEEEKDERMKRKHKEKKKAAAAAAAAAAVGGANASTTEAASSAPLGSKDKKEPQPTKSSDLSSLEEDDDDDQDTLQTKGHKLLSHLLSSTADITDGDDHQTLMKLTKLRIWQDDHISPEMQGVNLDDWEEGIDWEGGIDSDDERKNEENCKTEEMEPYNADTADCTPDFQPAKIEGGPSKRLRRTSHNQLYRDPIEILFEPRNPRLEALDLCATVDWEGACSESDDDNYEPPNVPLILQSSMAGKSMASLLAPLPSSRPLPFESHPSYQQRYDRELSSEITSTAELAQSNIPGANEALERYKEMRQRKREQMAKDKQNRVTEVMSSLSLTGTGRRITSSLMGPGGAERTGRPNRHAMGSSSAHDAEYVEQLEFVYSHALVKPELTLSEYRQFHRPRLPLHVVSPSRPWQFQTVVAQNKKESRGVSTAADGSTMIGSYHAMMSAGSKAQTKIRNEADLTPSLGDLVIMEYSEERPPLFMTKGMTCRIVNYYRGDRSRCPISAGGGDRPLRKRHGDRAAVEKGAGPAGPSGRIERPPRLIGPNQYTLKSAADLIGIIGLTKKKQSKEAAALEAKKAKEVTIDVLPEGVTEILHPKVHGPFIGEVEEGKTQAGLISNLFAASIFRHDSEPTDFLMILGQLQTATGTTTTATSNDELRVVLRPFPPNIFCVGQTEPRVKVFAPNTNEEKKFVNAFIGYQCAKNIERMEATNEMGATFEWIREKLFAHSKIPATQLRIRLKQVANFDRTNEGIWRLKKIGEDDFPGVEALGRKVSPEGIAAYESELAAMQRLRDLGLKDLHFGTNNLANVAMVMIYLNGAVQAALERKMKLKKVLDIKKRQKSPLLPYFEKAFVKLDLQYKDVKKRQEIAKFLYQELQLSPWNISGEFIDVHKRAQGSAMMKLTGIGDPSGVGEAFNFLREDERKPNKALISNNDGALNAQIKKITGTENDLRKLTMKQMASLLRSYGMKDKQIAVLKRWDRVHVIRDLSTKAASDGMGDEMERFARGEKLRLSDQRENYKKRVQEIWRRQVAALSCDAVDVSSRSDLGMGSAKEASEVDTESDGGKGKSNDSEDSDNDDDEFAAMMEMEMTSTGEANRLVATQLGDSSMRAIGGGLDTQELSKEARELAALQRQREEERAMQDGLEQKVNANRPDKTKKYQKVVRRKVIKTHLDGSQTVTFEFIVQKDKVEEVMAKIRSDSETKKSKTKEKDHNDDFAYNYDDAASGDETCVGHAFFEDEDNPSRTRKFGIRVKKETIKLAKARGHFPKKAAQSKLSSLAKHSRVEAQEQRKKKRLKLQEESELYRTHHRTKGTSNRKERGAARDRMPHVILSDRLESVRAAVESRPNAVAFHKPVPRDTLPSYYEIIHEPIDLQTIREKNRKYDYKTANSFLRDFDLMKRNAINFNGKGSALANEATEIYEFVKSTIEQNREEFDQMEEAVQDQINNGRRKMKLKVAKAKGKAPETASSKAALTAKLDGIEINLGTNLSFGFGGDSDSDDS